MKEYKGTLNARRASPVQHHHVENSCLNNCGWNCASPIYTIIKTDNFLMICEKKNRDSIDVFKQIHNMPKFTPQT